MNSELQTKKLQRGRDWVRTRTGTWKHFTRRVLSSSHLMVFHYITIESKNSKYYWSKSQFNQIRLFSSLKFNPIPPCKYDYYCRDEHNKYNVAKTSPGWRSQLRNILQRNTEDSVSSSCKIQGKGRQRLCLIYRITHEFLWCLFFQSSSPILMKSNRLLSFSINNYNDIS